MQDSSIHWQGQNFLSASANTYEAYDLYADNKKVAISFEMLGHRCEKAIQYSIYEHWYEEKLSNNSRAKEELELLASYHMPKVMAGLEEAGFHIENGEKISSLIDSENLSFLLKDGLFGDNASGIIVQCANFKVLPKKENNQGNLDNFLPAVWKFKCIDSKSFRSLERNSLIKTLNASYAQLQALMASAKISHALLSCMDATSHEIKHIWVEFDPQYYAHILKRVERIISNTKHGLWHMPLAKDVFTSCNRCNFKTHCTKKCSHTAK